MRSFTFLMEDLHEARRRAAARLTLRAAQSASPQPASSKTPGKGDPDTAGMREASDHVGVDIDKLPLFQTPVVTDCEPGGVDRADEMIDRHGGDDESRVIESIVAVDAGRFNETRSEEHTPEHH